jgi:hypothetical protein
MPQLKQPMTMQDRLLQEVVTLLRRICESWTVKLYAAAQCDRESFVRRTHIVLYQCDRVREILVDLTKPVLDKFIPKLARTFLDNIVGYDLSVRILEHRFWNGERHNIVCTAMLRSVLSRSTDFYDTQHIHSSFAQSLVMQTLDSVPRLLRFDLDVETQIDNSALLACEIHHLKKLRIFQYLYHCTDEVIEELALNCRHLRKITFTSSQGVTDASVQHLLQLRELRIVGLEHTRISHERYGLLLSGLPRITDIRFWEPASNILDHITVEKLDTISHVRGYAEDMNMLTRKCPNITHLDLCQIPGDLLHLSLLTALRSLTISNGHYGSSHLNAVLWDIGYRLTSLSLNNIRAVNLEDIVIMCPSLENLILWKCLFLTEIPNTRFDPDLPHFRSVITLEIKERFTDQIGYKYVQYYRRLKTISLPGVNFYTLDVMRDTLRRGTFTYLENFHIIEREEGALTMEAIELLIENCPYLKSIQFLITCPHLNPGLIRELKTRILRRNLDLEIE